MLAARVRSVTSHRRRVVVLRWRHMRDTRGKIFSFPFFFQFCDFRYYVRTYLLPKWIDDFHLDKQL